MSYLPPPHGASPWATAASAEAGFDPTALAAAARHAAECETPWACDLGLMVTSDFHERPPWNETLGPVRPRGGPNGLVLSGGRIVAEWGDTTRADMTFSVAKSYLAILAGLAWDRGLIGDPHEEVRRTVEDGGFEPPHNDAITWHHLLQQTSEWEGVMWDKPDLVDRNRASAGRPSAAPKRIRIMARTTIQCIKLNEPIATTPEGSPNPTLADLSAACIGYGTRSSRTPECQPRHPA